MNSHKIVLCGMHESGWETAKFLLENGIDISYFVTLSEEMAVTAQASGYKSFRDLADQYDIPLYFPHTYTLKDDRDIDFFREQKFDLLIQGVWQRLFPEEILKTLRVGAIGIHGSSEFLPKGRGRSPINWSLIEGKKRFIIHYFMIKPGIDDGDVFHYEMFDINEWDDCRTLYYKNSIVTRRVYLSWIPRLLRGDYAIMEQTGTPTYYPKRTPDDGRIDWSKTVFDIYNLIRAVTRPYPGAFTLSNGEKIPIWQAQPFDTRIAYPHAHVGQVVEVFSTGDFVVKCNSGLLLVTGCDTTGIEVDQRFE